MKLLSQTLLPAITLTNVFVLETFATTEVVVRSIYVNLVAAYGGTPSFRLALCPNGEALAFKHYVYYDTLIPSGGFKSDIVIALRAGDVLCAYASDANTSINLFGDFLEI